MPAPPHNPPQNNFFEMLFFGHIFNQKYFGTPKTSFWLSKTFKMVAMMTHLSETKNQVFFIASQQFHFKSSFIM